MPNNYDVKLTKTDGSSNQVLITLDRTADSGGYSVEHLSPDPPRQAIDAANYQQQSPDLGLVYDQDSFHRGFGQTIIERFDTADTANRARTQYFYSDGVLGMFKGEATMGYQEDDVDLILRNGRFESGTITDWTGTNVTLASETGTVRNGTYSLKATVGSDNGTITQSYSGSSTPLRSREMTFVAFVRRESGSGTITAKIVDSEGSTTGTSSTSAAASDWEVVYATRTIDSSATTITFNLTASTASDVFYIDDIGVVLTGGTTFTTPLEFKSKVYIGCGRALYEWDDSNVYWKAVYVDAAYAITDVESFGGALYLGFGTSQVYYRSTDASTFAVPSTNSGNGRYAEYFSKGRNASGNLALFKNRTNQISVSTDPSDTANWGTEIECGDSDRDVTNLFSSNDIVYVGREDGLFAYDRSTNKFRDLQPEANFFPDTDNFAVATGRSGSIFASGGDQSFWQIQSGFFDGAYQWNDLSYLFKASGVSGFGGRVSALAQDRNNLFVALADDLEAETSFPYTFPFSFAGAQKSQTIRLLSVRSQQESAGQQPETIAHTISTYNVSSISAMGKFKGDVRTSLFVCGNKSEDALSAISNDTLPRIIRVRMPIRNENPSINSLTEQRLSGNLYTGYLNFNFPDVNKSAVKLSLTGQNLDSNKYITVFYKTDDATNDDSSGWTVFGTNGKFTSSGQTITSDIQVNFKRIRFKIVFTSNSNGSGPKLTGFVFHSMWNPVEYRRWIVGTKLTDRRSLSMRRVRNNTLRLADLNNLETLRKEPLILYTDIDGSSHYVNMRYADELIRSRTQSTRNIKQEQTRRLLLQLTEVKTS